MLRIRGRYYRTIPLDSQGYETHTVELDPALTALIVMHCWNIGCEDGPEIDADFWVGMGTRECLHEAKRIMDECIRPAMEAARMARLLVCHVENATIAAKHPEAQKDAEPEPQQTPSRQAVPGWREQMLARAHGEDYLRKSPFARMDRAKVVAPLPRESFVYQTKQLDRMLHARGIQNLIYSGFATDMCVLRAEGGIEPMAALGYRVFLMRDATLGVEFADTLEEQLTTRWAIRYFETHFGDTISLADFLRALEEC